MSAATEPPRLARKRLRILDAARTVFREHGFVRTTVEQVARVARVGKGTIYEYFSSKEELFLAVCLRILEEDRESLRLLADRDPPPDIGDLIGTLVGLVPRHAADIKLFMELWVHVASLPGMDVRILETFRNFYEDLAAFLAARIDAGIASGHLAPRDARAAATLIVALVDGLYYQSLFLREPDAIGRAGPEVAQLLLDGLRAREETQ